MVDPKNDKLFFSFPRVSSDKNERRQWFISRSCCVQDDMSARNKLDKPGHSVGVPHLLALDVDSVSMDMTMKIIEESL